MVRWRAECRLVRQPQPEYNSNTQQADRQGVYIMARYVKALDKYRQLCNYYISILSVNGLEQARLCSIMTQYCGMINKINL